MGIEKSEGPDRVSFDEILVATIQETIGAVLGRSVSEAFSHHLQAFVGLSIDEMPSHLDVLFQSLRDSFGIGGDTLGRAIVRRLYHRCGMQFTETYGRTLQECVIELKDRWNSQKSSSDDPITKARPDGRQISDHSEREYRA